MQAKLERLVHEQQQSQRQEMLAQLDLIKQDSSGIELLITQFNALHPLFTQTLIKQFPKLSQADVQFFHLCSHEPDYQRNLSLTAH